MGIRSFIQLDGKIINVETISMLNFGGKSATPLLMQTEAAECGLACLAMVAGHHGHDVDLASLRGQHAISAKGSALAQLIQIAGRLQLSARPVRLELTALARLPCPAILHWDMNHFVVLVAVRKNAVVIHDPARGRRQLNLAELSRHFTGVALELAPSHDFVPRTQRRHISLTALLGKPVGLKRALLQVLSIALVLEVFAIAAPWFMQLVVDHALVAQDRDLIIVLALGFLLLALMQTAVTALRSWVLMVISSQINLQLIANLFRHLLRLPMDYFEKRHLGDVVSRFESLNAIQRTLTSSFVEAVVDGLMVIATLIVMWIYSPPLALVVCAAALLYGAVRWVWYRPLREAEEEQILRAAKQQSHFLESVRGVQSLKLFNRGPDRRAAYQNLAADHLNAGIRVQRLHIVFKAVNGVLFGAENVAVIGLGAGLVLQGGFSVGMLFAFIAYKQQFIARIIGLIEKGIELKMLGLHTERVADVALTRPEDADADIRSAPMPRRYDIEVRNLSFRYAAAESCVLNDVNLRIAEGESVAIVGASGCGKTTLLKIMLGLLPASGGEVLVGGVPVSRLGVEQYRGIIGTVMQEDQLFAGSIADNIAFFDPQPELERIHYCAQLAAVEQDIMAMPMAYHTLIGDMGTALSGGQRQRLLLARALYKNPKILFLDEATSHLDLAREQQVNQAIAQLKLTRVIVAHRPETIASADRVIVLDAVGQVDWDAAHTHHDQPRLHPTRQCAAAG